MNRPSPFGSPPAIAVHATTVAIHGSAVMLLGPAGAGKSDLGLRLIDRGARLVADDQTRLAKRENGLWAAPPPALAGLIEVWGLGIVRLSEWVEARLALVVDLATGPGRLPEPLFWTRLGVSIPLIHLCPLTASAAVKVEWAMRLATGVSGEGTAPDVPPGPGLHMVAGALGDNEAVPPQFTEQTR